MSGLRRIFRQRWAQKALAVAGAEYLRLVFATNRRVIPPEELYAIVDPHLPVILAMWHGQHFLAPFLKRPGDRSKVLISHHRDGEVNALSAERLVRAIREKDIATLQGAPRVGRKKAEQLILDLAEKMDDLLPDIGQRTSDIGGGVSDDAIRALVSLGYSSQDAERAVKLALDTTRSGVSAPDLIREALAKVTDARR